MKKPIKAWGGFNSHGELYSDPCLFKDKKNAESNYGIVKELLIISATTKAEIVRRVREVLLKQEAERVVAIVEELL